MVKPQHVNKLLFHIGHVTTCDIMNFISYKNVLNGQFVLYLQAVAIWGELKVHVAAYPCMQGLSFHGYVHVPGQEYGKTMYTRVVVDDTRVVVILYCVLWCSPYFGPQISTCAYIHTPSIILIPSHFMGLKGRCGKENLIHTVFICFQFQMS